MQGEERISAGPAAGAAAHRVPADRIAYRWADGVRRTEYDGEPWLLGGAEVWRIPAAFLPAADLLVDWRTERELGANAAFDQLVGILAALRRTAGAGFLDQELRDAEGRPLIRVQQVGGTLLRDLRALREPVGISRFAVMRVEDGLLIVERPGEH
ncbi:MAG: hypothetical protein ACKO2Y_01435, partial [Actinomycetota bacterium]